MGQLGNKQIMAKNIKYYMDLHGKTRQDVCDAIGVKYTTFTDWVKGNAYPRIDKIELMANYFGIKKSDLVEDKDDIVNDSSFACHMGEIIKTLRLKNNMTLEELGNKVGVGKSTVRKWETGMIENMRRDKIAKVANALDVSPAYLMGWTDDIHDTMQGGADDSFFTDHPGTYPVGYQSLPILGAVSCGVPRFKEDEQIGFIKNGERIRADFCVIAKGDSMIGARIYNGDIVFVRKQPTVENGEIAVVCIEDEALIKTVYHYKDKEMLVLRAENRDYEDLVYSGSELEKIKILGKVVASQIDFE